VSEAFAAQSLDQAHGFHAVAATSLSLPADLKAAISEKPKAPRCLTDAA